MAPGTWGEWVGAVATAGATIVALYFGVRDQAKHGDRQTARRELHAFAADRLRHIERWAKGTENPDGSKVTDPSMLDAESARAVLIADRLTPRRARSADRVLRQIYGDRSINTARLYPERADPHVQDLDGTRNEFGVADSLTVKLMGVDTSLVVDREPGPLRRRGAFDDESERAELRSAYERLAKV